MVAELRSPSAAARLAGHTLVKPFPHHQMKSLKGGGLVWTRQSFCVAGAVGSAREIRVSSQASKHTAAGDPVRTSESFAGRASDCRRPLTQRNATPRSE